MINRFFNTKSALYFFLFILFVFIGIYWLKGHTSPQLIGDYYFSVNTEKKIIALTFDDGPDPVFTKQILDILKKHDVKATFFILGSQAQKHPELVQRIYREGHELGNHSWSHARLIFKSPQFIRDEITRTDDLIRKLGYTGQIHFRAPFGNKLIVLPWVLVDMNRPHILFDIIPKDWEEPAPQIITNRIMEQLHPGAIILLHDSGGNRSTTVSSLEATIIRIKEQGYLFLTISELLTASNSTNP